MEEKIDQTERLLKHFHNQSFPLDEVNDLYDAKNIPPVKQTDKWVKVISRPQVSMSDLCELPSFKSYLEDAPVRKDVLHQAETQLKYAGYIEKEKQQADKLQRLDHIKIPEGFDYFPLASLSHEAKEKLNRQKPQNLGQASRISGINPSDISVLLVHLSR